jgi:hypothetical protein
MAFAVSDRVRETTATTGTGTLDLGGAVSGFKTFVSGIGDGNVTYYAIVHRTSAEFEIGIGTVTDASTDTLSRTTVLSSSNSNSAVTFSAGTKDVFCTQPASKAVFEDNNDDVTLPDDLILGSDSSVLKFGADSDTTLTHTDGTGLTLNSTNKLTFGDAASFVQQSSNGVLRIDGEATVDINASTAVTISNDLKLDSDSAVLGFGADNDTTLTHTDGTGLTLNSANKLTFRDTALYLNSSTDGQLDIVADTEVQIAATTVDINGDVDISGTLTVAGALDFGEANISNVGTLGVDEIFGDGDTNTKIAFSGSDVITVTAGGDAQVTFTNGAIVPSTDNDIDLGTSSVEFKDAFFDGTVTSDAFAGPLTGDVTGNVSGTAATVTGAAQSNITSLGTLTTLTVDNVIINGSTIGHTGDTDLMTVASGVLTVAGEISVTTLDIGGTNVTSTAAELNILDGVTSTAAELNILDGVTSTAAELNTLDGITAVVGELNALDLGSTAVGTAIASKAVILDSNKDYTGIRNLTITGELDGATLDLSGDADIAGTTNLDNTDIDGTLVVDGSNISLDSTSTLNIDNSNTSNGVTIGTATSGVPISIGHSTSEVTVNDNLTVTGNFTVSGTSTTVDSTTVAVADSMFKLAKDQGTSADALDFGFYGQYGVGGTAKFAGVFRDVSATGDPFTFFDDLQAEPGTTVNTSGTGYDLADIAAGGATFADNVTITGDADVDGTLEADAITVNGTTLAEFISDTTGAMVSSNTETGITVTYQDADNTIDFALAAAQTTITSLLATDIKIGEDDQTKIDFETANEIHFFADNVSLISLTNANSGDAVLTVPTADKNFTIKGTDGSSAITALDIDMALAGKATFNGDVVVTGDLTVTGDDIVMGTNTSGHIMVADGTNFNPVAVSGDVSIAANGAVTIANTAVETAMIAADAITEAKIADNAVENEHINDNVISGQTALTSGLATTDELLISDGGTIKRMDVSVLSEQFASADEATALAIALG